MSPPTLVLSFWWLSPRRAAEQTGRAVSQEGLLLQPIRGVAGSQAGLWERRAPGAPSVLTSLLPDPPFVPPCGSVPRAFLLISPSDQWGPSAPPWGSSLWPGMSPVRALEGGTIIAVVMFHGFAVLSALHAVLSMYPTSADAICSEGTRGVQCQACLVPFPLSWSQPSFCISFASLVPSGPTFLPPPVLSAAFIPLSRC